MQKLFAFWNYNYQSYTGIKGFLGSEVAEIKDNGHVKVKGYGGGVFTPVKFLPLKKGEEILKKLEQLRHEYRTAHDNVDLEYQAKVDEIMKGL